MFTAGNVEEDRLATFGKTHKFIKYLDHELHGRIYIYQHYATNQLLLMKERIANNSDHLRQEEALIAKREMLRHPNIIVLKDWSIKKDSKICAEFFIIRAYYQYFVNNIELVCKGKAKATTPLDHVELMQLLYDGIEGLAYLQTQGVSHGFIRPELFAIDDSGSHVIVDKLLEGTSMDANRQVVAMGLEPYASPIVWNNLMNDRKNPSNPYKDDSFCLGLVLLRAANLTSPKDIFESSGIVNQQKLLRLIDKAGSRYDDVILFRQVLEKLLQIEETQRADACTIKAGLPSREQMQLFFEEGVEELFFDGPQAQIYNASVGKESIMPQPARGAGNQSRYMDTSNVLSGLYTGQNQSVRLGADNFGSQGPNQSHYFQNNPSAGFQKHGYVSQPQTQPSASTAAQGFQNQVVPNQPYNTAQMGPMGYNQNFAQMPASQTAFGGGNGNQISQNFMSSSLAAPNAGPFYTAPYNQNGFEGMQGSGFQGQSPQGMPNQYSNAPGFNNQPPFGGGVSGQQAMNYSGVAGGVPLGYSQPGHQLNQSLPPQGLSPAGLQYLQNNAGAEAQLHGAMGQQQQFTGQQQNGQINPLFSGLNSGFGQGPTLQPSRSMQAYNTSGVYATGRPQPAQ